MANKGVERPGPVSEVVGGMASEMGVEGKEATRSMEKDGFSELRSSMGMYISNRFVHENRELTGSRERKRCPVIADEPRLLSMRPDDVSGMILEVLWRRLRGEGSLL